MVEQSSLTNVGGGGRRNSSAGRQRTGYIKQWTQSLLFLEKCQTFLVQKNSGFVVEIPPPKKNPLFIKIIKFKNILHVLLINYFKSSLILHNEVQYVLHVKYKFSNSFVGFCFELSQAGDCRNNYIDTCVSERLVGQKKQKPLHQPSLK